MGERTIRTPFVEPTVNVKRLRVGTRLHNGLDVLQVTPQNAAAEPPVLVVPGYVVNANALTMRDLAVGIAQGQEDTSGKEAHVVGYRGRYPGTRLTASAGGRELVHKRAPDSNTISHIEYNKADALLHYADSIFPNQQVDIVGHSLGALSTTLAVAMKPERFRRVILVTPDGLHNELPVSKVTLSFLKQIVPELIAFSREKATRRSALQVLQTSMSMFAIHPRRSLWDERRAARNSDHTFALHPPKDTMFYPEFVVFTGSTDEMFHAAKLRIPPHVRHEEITGGHIDVMTGSWNKQIMHALT